MINQFETYEQRLQMIMFSKGYYKLFLRILNLEIQIKISNVILCY